MCLTLQMMTLEKYLTKNFEICFRGFPHFCPSKCSLDFGRSRQLLRNEIFDPSTPSIRKVYDRGKQGENGGRMEGVNGVSSGHYCQPLVPILGNFSSISHICSYYFSHFLALKPRHIQLMCSLVCYPTIARVTTIPRDCTA